MSTYFQNGKKIVDGVEYDAVRFYECLSSNGFTVYTAILWSDGEASCNCPGWTRHKERRCKHSNQVKEIRNDVLVTNTPQMRKLPSPATPPVRRSRLMELD